MWEKVKFTDVVKDVTGGNKKLNQDKYLDKGKYPIVDQGEKFIGGYFDDDLTVKVVKPVVVFGDHSKCIKYVNFDFILGADGVKVLEPCQKLDSKYLFHFLKTLKLPNVGYSRHFKFLKESIIPLPPLPIQEKIATILDKADELRRKDKDLQAKYDELAQAIFTDMFGDPVRNEKGWEVKKLEELGRWATGGTPSRSNNQYFNGTIPWVSSGELNSMYICNTKEKISLNAISNSAAKLIEPYSLMLGMYDTAALKSSINTISMTCNQAIAYSKVEHGNLTYIYKVLQLTKEYHKSRQRGVRQKNLNLSIIKDIEIIFPPIHLQEAFAKKIELINRLKAQTNTEKSEELFQSLLQKAFKGELVS
ncbi:MULTISPECIES: restriction endonuclease subunit S [Sphingobacterium]|uniref:Type I restriction modification DNA specificity domain n=1 Tax=Sphingobacterium multivorum TaxID=28454 RepID=A0A2X2IYA3_SPHMU|nr:MULTISPECIES: restriction endonuclease subunit S [Sphingobacterium]QRQ60629.1 restriction endonuclease subunit S [Sphingobacterium multivorum]SPZ87272.1 Type I restriction modification DNA specificity domain [Sphingobacterium multivorum]